MSFKIVDKKIFVIFITVGILIMTGFFYGVYYFGSKFLHKKDIIKKEVSVSDNIVSENDTKENSIQINNENSEPPKEEVPKEDASKIVTEYVNQSYQYSLKFPEKWFMNNDDSESKLVKVKQDDGTFLQMGGQTFWSNYADINKYSPQNKPDDFHLLGLTIYQDASTSIDDFAKKIGASEAATREEFQTTTSMAGVQYVAPGIVEKNPSIIIIFKKDDKFFVFHPAFLYGDSTSSDVMEGIVKSFSVN